MLSQMVHMSITVLLTTPVMEAFSKATPKDKEIHQQGHRQGKQTHQMKYQTFVGIQHVQIQSTD
jgi:hypothetical protein